MHAQNINLLKRNSYKFHPYPALRRFIGLLFAAGNQSNQITTQPPPPPGTSCTYLQLFDNLSAERADFCGRLDSHTYRALESATAYDMGR